MRDFTPEEYLDNHSFVRLAKKVYPDIKSSEITTVFSFGNNDNVVLSNKSYIRDWLDFYWNMTYEQVSKESLWEFDEMSDEQRLENKDVIKNIEEEIGFEYNAILELNRLIENEMPNSLYAAVEPDFFREDRSADIDLDNYHWNTEEEEAEEDLKANYSGGGIILEMSWLPEGLEYKNHKEYDAEDITAL